MKDEALFKEKVDEFAVLRIERGEQSSRLSKTAKLAKNLIGMKGSDYKKITNIIYSTTPAAKERADKKNTSKKKPLTKLEKAAEQFAELYSQLTLLGEGNRLELLMANKGVKIEAAFEGALTDKYELRKPSEKTEELWEELMGGEEIPATTQERAKCLINAGLVCLNDVAEISDKMNKEILEEAAEDCGVIKKHLVKAVGLRVKAIKKGEDVIPEAVDAISSDAEQLCETLSAMIPGEKEE